ncbi:MAG: RNA polymerase subunit sigma-70 [Candidatus Dormiibacterota bacterium]
MWIEPYPDGDLVDVDERAAPAARYELAESVEIAFVAALQHLPGRQRAVLLLREVLGFSAAEVASMLETTATSVNSLLQRARRTVADRVPAQSQQATLRTVGDEAVRQLVQSYVDAWQRADVPALVGLLTKDATWSMPPDPTWFSGIPSITRFLVQGPMQERWRRVVSHANGQPAVAGYLWDERTSRYRAWVLDVLTLRERRVQSVTAFIGGGRFGRFGLPEALD